MTVLRGWSDIHAHLERTHTGVTLVRDGQVRLAGVPGRNGEGVVVEVVLLPDADRVAISTDLGSGRYLPPLEVLHMNFLLAIGTVCMYRGNCHLRHTTSIAELHAHQLDAMVASIAEKSTAVRTRLTHG